MLFVRFHFWLHFSHVAAAFETLVYCYLGVISFIFLSEYSCYSDVMFLGFQVFACKVCWFSFLSRVWFSLKVVVYSCEVVRILLRSS